MTYQLDWVPERKVERPAKRGFARSAAQKAVGILKHKVDMVVTSKWELSKLVGEISEL